MSKKLSWLQSVPIHSLLFAIYPIVALLAINASELDVSSGLRPLLLSAFAAGLLLLLFQLIYRDWKRAALLTTIIMILFFSYGHVYILLKSVNFNGFFLFRHRTLVPLWLVLAGLTIWWASRKSLNLQPVTYGLNVIGLLLLIFPIVQLVSFSIQSQISQANAEKDTSTLNLQPGSQPPDIYYIILDGYGRADVLEKQFGYDNSAFLNELRSMGFIVADCSQSNYAQTQLSLASSMNFDYIDALSDRFVPGSEDRTGLDALIHHGA
ncbi:MAG TPA: hypothetical protein VKP08_11545, partial [Anaerolineales bacterium]|nr:hypothetical protein [Anaerolineales bacterium]